MTRISNSTDDKATSTQKIKFLYSYGGKILPRPTDGKLRYAGGHTRVLAADRSITFAELMVRFVELCGSSMTLKCKLPTEDLDVLVTITCDEDLVTIVREYDRFLSSARKDLKITAVLFPRESLKTISPPPSTVSSLDFSAAMSSFLATGLRCRNPSPAMGFPAGVRKGGSGFRCYDQLANTRHPCFVPHQNYWRCR
ncbi:protein PAL OF QUIRKY-like [Rhododendron vialii]|uniref:protein PAL OF QUIRKY-like n=1 Tax=Rhododendron vialii TaxID=182163 RepID=UPI00265FF8CC|nr:protein PAL OF QUIRKY-like [Rhododendron vialii]